jgi:hypothetical protein
LLGSLRLAIHGWKLEQLVWPVGRAVALSMATFLKVCKGV